MQHALWQSVLGEIELTVSEANYSTWFKNTELIERPDGSVIVSVANIFAKRQFETKFDGIVKQLLAKNGVEPKRVIYEIKRDQPKVVSRQPDDFRNEKTVPAINKPVQDSGLNKRYTFNNFVVGSSNDLAYTACRAVAENPGVKYNPLFLYGGVGLGKTHLLQSVGNEIRLKKPDLKVLYISSETFVKEFLDSIRYKKKGFAEKYRGVDVLIVDDMQFIAGKEKTQEEFFHTFNTLHQANKQIIISSDKPPKSIPTLTERLRSRFEWGMAIDIQMPDFETRCAIIEAKAGLSGVELKREVVEYLATNIKTNIRELEGALNQLLAYSEMRDVEPDVMLAEGLIGNTRRSRPQHLTPKQIIEKTASHFGVDVREMLSEKRDRHIVEPRQVAMYLLRSELHLSFPKIAHELGRKDHTTAIHSVEKIEKAIKLDIVTREHIADIREKLYG